MRISEMNWMMVEEYLRRDDRAVLPLGCTEQHAYLSLSTDSILAERLAVDAAEPLGVPVFPVLAYGITPYFRAFPGTITLRVETYMSVVGDILDAITEHGFKRILIVNGHGSNHAICDLAARKCVLATGAICAATTVNAAVDPSLVADVLNAERKGGPGSVGHACEYETAMMLHLHPDRVNMNMAERDIGQLKLKYFNWDHPEPSAYSWQDWWSRFSRVGVCGDAAAATPEAGARLFDVTVERFVELLREFRTIPIRERVDHH